MKTSIHLPYRDRVEAGRILAEALESYRDTPDLLVLGLPRGGVPIASEVARALGAELDVLIVRKLGTPGRGELAMGAIASGGITVRNRNILAMCHVSEQDFQRIEKQKRRELLEREKACRGQDSPPAIKGRCVILVDDGLATGATMKAAVEAVRLLGAERIVVAVPVGAQDTCDELSGIVDELVCCATPAPFGAIGYFYKDFTQVRDEEVRDLLAASRTQHQT